MIAVLVVTSSLRRIDEEEKRLAEFLPAALAGLNEKPLLFFLNSPEGVDQVRSQVEKDLTAVLVVVASGGTEAVIQRIAERFSAPLLLWANPHLNSLAAALEAYAALKKNRPIKLVYADFLSQAGAEEISRFAAVCRAGEGLDQARVGAIGAPSPWLLNSPPESRYAAFALRWIAIPLKDLRRSIAAVDPKAIERVAVEFASGRVGKKKITDEAWRNALRVHLALQQLAEEEKLAGLTIRCFDLLSDGVTACLAVSLHPDQGLVIGCEGDRPALLGLLAARYLTGQAAWMANPARIDKVANTVTLAHCAVACSLLAEPATLVPHMESGLGVAFSGPMKKEPVTLFRFSATADEIVAVRGRVTATALNDHGLCRTQALVELEGAVGNWLENTPGNHQILAYGDLTPLLADLAAFRGIRFRLI